jgi:ABC-type branched-subunit amino acid transport system ATPase component
MSSLAVRGLSHSFGGLQAVSGVDFEVPDGGITALIGPNGAGKTTLFNLISGALRPQSGSIRLDDRELAGLPAHRIAVLGVCRTFQTTALSRACPPWRTSWWAGTPARAPATSAAC